MPRKRSKWAIACEEKFIQQTENTQRRRPQTRALLDRGRSVRYFYSIHSPRPAPKGSCPLAARSARPIHSNPRLVTDVYTVGNDMQSYRLTTRIIATGTRTESGGGEPSVHQARHVCRGQNDTRSKADPPYPLGPPCLNVHGYRTQLSQVHTPNPLSPNIALMYYLYYMVNRADNEAVRIHLQHQHVVCANRDFTRQIWISISVGTDYYSSHLLDERSGRLSPKPMRSLTRES